MRPDTYVPLFIAIGVVFFIFGASTGNNSNVNFSDITSSLSNVAMAAAAIIALSSWKKQISGSDSHELAKRVLECTFRLRDSIKTVRNPIILANEYPKDYRPAIGSFGRDNMSENEINNYEAKALGSVYGERLKIVKESWVELHSLRVEMEALWGSDSKDSIDDFMFELHRLISSVQDLINCRDQGIEPGEKISDVTTASLSSADNTKFGREITVALEKIIEQMKGHLYR